MRVPVAVGAKVTWIVQVAFTAMDAAVQVSVSVKSPVTVTCVTVSAALPVFVTVMVCGALAVATACVAKVSDGGVEGDGGLRGGGGGEEWNLPEAASVGCGAEFADAAVAGGQGCGGRERDDGCVGERGAVDAPAVGGGAGGDLRSDVDAGVERDVESVGVVGVDDDAVGRSVGEIAADVGPAGAASGGTIEVRRIDAVAGEAHDGGVDGLAGGVVRVGGERGDVEAPGVEGSAGAICNGGEWQIGPRGSVGCGGPAGRGEEMASEGAAAIERAGHPGVEDLGAGVLRGGGVACGAGGSEGSDSGVGGGAGGCLRASKHLADGVRRGPEDAGGRWAAPDAAGSDENVGGEGRVEEPGGVDEESSLEIWVAPMVGAPVKLAAVQAAPRVHWRMLTPAAVETYQSEGLVGSMATVPPSPVESCGHAPDVEAEVAAVPFAPRPTSRVAGSVGCWAKLTISAREPRPPLRFWKWVASSGEQGVDCWLTPSVDRQRPPSLPR